MNTGMTILMHVCFVSIAWRGATRGFGDRAGGGGGGGWGGGGGGGGGGGRHLFQGNRGTHVKHYQSTKGTTRKCKTNS